MYRLRPGDHYVVNPYYGSLYSVIDSNTHKVVCRQGL